MGPAMSPDRWRRITEAFHRVRSRGADARPALLDEACGDDLAMRVEVAALLAADSEAGIFGETSLFAPDNQPAHLEPGTRLGHYCIASLIGAGGMGAVYRAHDTTLDRDVAIKMLSTTLHDADTRRRLLHEARAAAAVSHPHLCSIYEIGETEGQAYIAMELVEGRRLDELIAAGGLPPGDIFRYGLQIADAISHAHARGIVHRDLKPANVMISQFGTAKVLDFGLAKLLPLSAGGDRPFTVSQTASGVVAGTAGYMAPEQVLGRPSDERTDVFSFGVLLYEMATGHPAFSGTTPIEVHAAVLHAQPQPITSVRPDVPSELSQVVERALDKDPARRYQQMSALSDHLRRVQDAEVAISVASRSPRRRRAALIVAATATAFALVTAASWTRVSALFERPARSALRPPSGRLEKGSLAAYRAVTEARGLYDASRWEAALDAAKRAADLDPEYAEAWALLGKIYARLASPPGLPSGGSREDYRANALVSARRAVDLDSSSYEGHVALALAHRNLSQIEPSRAAARKAIALAPKFAEAYDVLADTYAESPGSGCGHDHDNAIAMALQRQAQSLDPNFADGISLVNLLKYEKRFDEALRILDDALRRHPSSRRIRRTRAWILLEVGRLDEAERMLREAAADGGIRGNDHMYLAGIALKRGQLEAAAEGFENYPPSSDRGRIEIARQYIEANVPGPALVHLERALRADPECAGFLVRTKAPYWSVIRSVPAARALLAKYNGGGGMQN
jgi:tetratricopeptide (TPR) repeat protein